MWIKLDDNTINHKKFRRAATLLGGKEAFARVTTCWFAGMNYANHNQTDGFLATEVVAGFVAFVGAPLDVAAGLVACRLREDGAGLWEVVEGGYRIHDYSQYQPDAETTQALRATRSAAGRVGGIRSGESRRGQAVNEASMKQVASFELEQIACADEATNQAPGEANRVAKGKQTTNPVPVPVPDPGTPASLQGQRSWGGPRLPARAATWGSAKLPTIRRTLRVPLFETQHQDFLRRLGGDVTAAARLEAFYADVDARWASTGEVPAGRPMEAWQREFDRAFASPRPGPGDPSARELAEAKEIRRKSWGRCPHDEDHAYADCVRAIALERRAVSA